MGLFLNNSDIWRCVDNHITIPYTIDSDFSDTFVKRIRSAMDSIEDDTGFITYKEKTSSDTLYLEIIKSPENENKTDHSLKIIYLYQSISTEKETIRHELGHSLSLLHEQMRPDRDNYIEVLMDNIEDGYFDQFQKLSKNDSTSVGDFDFKSNMMYSKNAFAKACNKWAAGYTFMKVWRRASTIKDKFITFRESTKSLRMYTVNTDGTIGSRIQKTALKDVWTHCAIPSKLPVKKSKSVIIFYNCHSGTFVIHPITDKLIDTDTIIETGTWRTDWTNVEIWNNRTNQSNNNFLVLLRGSGEVNLHCLNTDGTIGTETVHNFADTNEQTLIKVSDKGRIYFTNTEGVFRVYQISEDGNTEEVKNYNWSKGWTNISIDNYRDRLVIYKRDSGDMHPHRLKKDGTLESSDPDNNEIWPSKLKYKELSTVTLNRRIIAFNPMNNSTGKEQTHVASYLFNTSQAITAVSRTPSIKVADGVKETINPSSKFTDEDILTIKKSYGIV